MDWMSFNDEFAAWRHVTHRSSRMNCSVVLKHINTGTHRLIGMPESICHLQQIYCELLLWWVHVHAAPRLECRSTRKQEWKNLMCFEGQLKMLDTTSLIWKFLSCTIYSNLILITAFLRLIVSISPYWHGRRPVHVKLLIWISIRNNSCSLYHGSETGSLRCSIRPPTGGEETADS